jgi:hypothetical protein
MESHSSSKKSKSRPAKDRGPKRKAKALARLEAHREKKGLTGYDPGQAEKNASASMGVRGTMATAIQTEMIENNPVETVNEKNQKNDAATTPRELVTGASTAEPRALGLH